MTETRDVYMIFADLLRRFYDAMDQDDAAELEQVREGLHWFAAVYPFHAKAYFDAIREEIDAKQTDVPH